MCTVVHEHNQCKMRVGPVACLQPPCCRVMGSGPGFCGRGSLWYMGLLAPLESELSVLWRWSGSVPWYPEFGLVVLVGGGSSPNC